MRDEARIQLAILRHGLRDLPVALLLMVLIVGVPIAIAELLRATVGLFR